MLDLLKVSVRNVGRNKRRSLITMITVFIGVFVVTGTRGLLNGLQGEIRSGLTRKMHGDLQIHKNGYQDSLDANPYKVMFPYSSTLRDAVSAVPGIEAIAPRLKVMALLNHQKSQTTIPVLVQGIDSATELKVCPRLKDALVEGSLLDSALEKEAQSVVDASLEEATGLDDVPTTSPTPQAPVAVGNHQVMVTPSLLRGMNASIRDEVVLLIQDQNNMQQAVVAKIVGVLDFGMPGAAARMAWVDFSTLQKVAGVGDQVAELALLTQSKLDENKIAQDLRIALGDQPLVVETWLELSGLFRDAMGLQNFIFNAVLAIVFTIMVSAIVNTSLMTVMERTREIGALMALGYRRFHILFLFLTESVVIALCGSAAALSFILIILNRLSQKGIQFRLPGQAVATVLYPDVTLPFVFLVVVLAMFSALLASFFPAYRASKLKPVEALSSV